MRAELINSMGSDLSVVNAARVSFDKESEWEWVPKMDGGYNKLHDKDVKLIQYLAKHNHFTPFTHCIITLRETVPIFVARQRFKHTVGFTYNEVSRRYVDDTPEFFVPDEWRGKPKNAKQGSSDEVVTEMFNFVGRGVLDRTDLPEVATVKDQYEYFIDITKGLYNEMIKAGVAPEQARMVLPQSMYTSYYVTGSLAAFTRAYNLRSDAHAQKEIQELAISWKNIIEPLFPESWKALTND